MNDKQKNIALEMIVAHVRWSKCLDDRANRTMWEKTSELLAAFDAAADAPKRKYTVWDIEKPQIMRQNHGDYWYIRCGDYDWTSDGWFRQSEGASGFPKHVADVIYAGLVATGNVPEVGE